MVDAAGSLCHKLIILLAFKALSMKWKGPPDKRFFFVGCALVSTFVVGGFPILPVKNS